MSGKRSFPTHRKNFVLPNEPVTLVAGNKEDVIFFTKNQLPPLCGHGAATFFTIRLQNYMHITLKYHAEQKYLQ